MISDNGICILFDRHAKTGKNEIFSTFTQFQTGDVPLMNCSSASHIVSKL